MTYIHDDKSQKEDAMLKKLFSESFTTENPSDNFNRILMDRVMYDWVSNTGSRDLLVDRRNRLWIIPGVVLMLVVGYLIDVGYLGESNINQVVWLDGFAQLGAILFGWMRSMHWLIPASLVAVGGLLLFDRFLQKLYKQ